MNLNTVEISISNDATLIIILAFIFASIFYHLDFTEE